MPLPWDNQINDFIKPSLGDNPKEKDLTEKPKRITILFRAWKSIVIYVSQATPIPSDRSHKKPYEQFRWNLGVFLPYLPSFSAVIVILLLYTFLSSCSSEIFKSPWKTCTPFRTRVPRHRKSSKGFRAFFLTVWKTKTVLRINNEYKLLNKTCSFWRGSEHSELPDDLHCGPQLQAQKYIMILSRKDIFFFLKLTFLLMWPKFSHTTFVCSVRFCYILCSSQ